MPEFKNLSELDAFNKLLFEKAIKDMDRTHYAKDRLIKELWEEDMKRCHTLPPVAYDCYRLEQLKTDKRGLIHFDKNVYSTDQAWLDRRYGVKALTTSKSSTNTTGRSASMSGLMALISG